MSDNKPDEEVIADSDKLELDRESGENAGAILFFDQVITMYNQGHREVTINYSKKTGETGAIKMTLEEVQPDEQ